MSDDTSPEPAPDDLCGRGLAVWDDINRRYTFTAEELALVLQIARTVQKLDELNDALNGADFVVSGSNNQPVAHPLLDTAKSYRLALVSMLRHLDLPADEDDIPLTASQRKAQRAANSRWSGHTRRAELRGTQ